MHSVVEQLAALYAVVNRLPLYLQPDPGCYLNSGRCYFYQKSLAFDLLGKSNQKEGVQGQDS